MTDLERTKQIVEAMARKFAEDYCEKQTSCQTLRCPLQEPLSVTCKAEGLPFPMRDFDTKSGDWSDYIWEAYAERFEVNVNDHDERAILYDIISIAHMCPEARCHACGLKSMWHKNVGHCPGRLSSAGISAKDEKRLFGIFVGSNGIVT